MARRSALGGIVIGKKDDLHFKPTMQLPCGKCMDCKVARAREWSFRLMHEASLHSRPSWFATFTYDQDHYVPDLVYRHHQLFMKRLRHTYGATRHFTAGEYGEQLNRPHFHSCLFGLEITDLVPWDQQLYTSKTIDKIWKQGAVKLAYLTRESAQYVAAYVTKKITGKKAEEHYARVNTETGELYNLTPEFSRMSLKPGIGSGWISKYTNDVYNYDHLVEGRFETRPPRYYDKYLERTDPTRYEALKKTRAAKAAQAAAIWTPQRRKAQDACTRARINRKRRTL